jgi:hypothetical protein
MYKFSKQSWHVKFFKWIFNSDPTTQFKTMCPYFWTYVLVFLFLPLILIIKLFGSFGTKLLDNLRTYQQRRIEKIKEEFILKCSKDLTNQECYDIFKSKCYNKYWYILSSDIDKKINNGYEIINDKKYKIKKENTEKRQIQYIEIKESKVFNILSYVFGIISIVFLLIFTIKAIKSIIIITNWKIIGIGLLGTISILVIAYLIYLIVKFIISPFISYLMCFECKLCKKIKIFKYISFPFKIGWDIIKICAEMTYATYKKHCPLIKWEEE